MTFPVRNGNMRRGYDRSASRTSPIPLPMRSAMEQTRSRNGHRSQQGSPICSGTNAGAKLYGKRAMKRTVSSRVKQATQPSRQPVTGFRVKSVHSIRVRFTTAPPWRA